jgi:hypothetical protein
VTITLQYKDGNKLGPKFKLAVGRFADKANAASLAATQRAASEIEDQGRDNIRAAGSSATMQDAFHATVTTSRAAITIRVTHDVPYWIDFEEGAVIHGKPMLWIPLSFATEAQGVRAKDFPAPLFQVNRKSGKAPLLVTTGGRPMYFGKQSITIPKKWSLRDIVREVADQMGQFYKEALKGG